MSTWVEQVEGDDVDLESIPANHNTIKVNTDTGDQGAGNGMVAVHAINNATGGNARGLKVEGITELRGTVQVLDHIAGIGGNTITFDDIVCFDTLVNPQADIACDNDIIVARTSRLHGAVQVGPGGAAGTLDAGGGVDAQNLLIGSDGDRTEDVVIGLEEHGVNIVEDLDVGRNLAVTGDASVGGDLTVTGAAGVTGALTVGPGGDAGVIDAIGNQNIEIGGGATTVNLLLGQNGHLVSLLSDILMNGNTIWLDAANLFGIHYNVAGINPGHPSIDLIINGNVTVYADDEGIHNNVP